MTYTIRIEHDDDAQSPLEYEETFNLVCWHRQYNLGTEQPSKAPDEYRLALADGFEPRLDGRIAKIEKWWDDRYPTGESARAIGEWHEGRYKDINDAVERVLAKHIIELPLYLYDHSGITMNTSGFSCQWDSGQVGFIYITKADARKQWGRLTKKRVEQILDWMRDTVKTYDQYLRGDVYGFVIEKDGEVIESCWGFFGDDHMDNGMFDNIPDEHHELFKKTVEG